MSFTQDKNNRKDRTQLKTYFETGDRPTEDEFEEAIDSWINQLDDDIHAVDNKIGIGTDDPDAKLHVQAAGGDEGSAGVVRIDTNSTADDGNLRFGIMPDDHAWVQSHGNVPFHINRLGNNTVLNLLNGNVGIGGLGNPAHKLHVNGDIGVANHIYGNKSNKPNDDDALLVHNGSQLQLFGPRHTGKPGSIVLGAKKDNGNADSGKIIFSQNSQTGWKNNVIIDNNGSVGIGEMNPKHKLHVQGDIAVTNNIYGDKSGKQNDEDILSIVNSSQIQLHGDRHTGKPGSIVIGPTYDEDKPNSGKTIFSQRKKGGGWQSNMIIDHSGNVGIGTSSPDSTLHIKNDSGSKTGLRLETNAANNRVLVSDNHGNGTWKDLADGGLAGNSLVPKGVIVMWSGSGKPSGWEICDGNNGNQVNGVIIPDLRGRFIVGQKNGDNHYGSIGGTGGEDFVTLTENEMPIHDHNKGNLSIVGSGSHGHSGDDHDAVKKSQKWVGKNGGLVAQEMAGSNEAAQASIWGGGNHTHSTDHFRGNVGTKGGGQSHENRPPYYVLAFIIKV